MSLLSQQLVASSPKEHVMLCVTCACMRAIYTSACSKDLCPVLIRICQRFIAIHPPGEAVSNLQVTMPTATTLSITWTVPGSVERFEITYSYTVNRCLAPQGTLRTDTISIGSTRSYTLRDLSEDSTYAITVSAIYTAPPSVMATITASTLTSGESYSYHSG